MLTLVSCSTDEAIVQNKATNNNVKGVQMPTYCGTIFSVNSIWSNGAPSTFIGIRYDLLLDTPYLGNTKGYFILNNANNSTTTEQFSVTNNVCRNDLIYY